MSARNNVMAYLQAHKRQERGSSQIDGIVVSESDTRILDANDLWELLGDNDRLRPLTRAQGHSLSRIAAVISEWREL